VLETRRWETTKTTTAVTSRTARRALTGAKRVLSPRIAPCDHCLPPRSIGGG
jgi:hypothetical protein